MGIADRETVLFVYMEARETMDHDEAIKHAADICGVDPAAVEQALDEEAVA